MSLPVCEVKRSRNREVKIDTYSQPLLIESPVTCYAGLSGLLGADRVFLLESLAGPSVDLRMSLIGITGPLEVSVHRGRVTLRGAERMTELVETALTGAGAVRRGDAGLELTEPDGLFELPRTINGLLGSADPSAAHAASLLVHLGYDAVRYIERLPPAVIEDDDPVPDAVFSLVHAVIIVDLRTESAQLLTAESEYWEPLDVGSIVRAATDPGQLDAEVLDVPVPHEIADDTHREDYLAAVARCLEHIRVGDIYQVQIGHQVTVRTEASAMSVYRRLRSRNPSPYMSLVPVADRTLVGASPELFLRVEGGTITMRPIAGTARRTGMSAADAVAAANLCVDEKERAEHVMLVDLCRNDLGRVCTPMSTEVEELMRLEQYSHVFHLVSTVSAELSPNLDVWDVIASSFPAGTMTGAPKIRAMEIIEATETRRRGLYAGTFGVVDRNGSCVMGLAIRMAVKSGDRYTLRASAGVVADSTPEGEWGETLSKLAATYWAVTGEELL